MVAARHIKFLTCDVGLSFFLMPGGIRRCWKRRDEEDEEDPEEEEDFGSLDRMSGGEGGEDRLLRDSVRVGKPRHQSRRQNMSVVLCSVSNALDVFWHGLTRLKLVKLSGQGKCGGQRRYEDEVWSNT